MGRARAIMIQGTMSGVGKSFLCAALCRILRQDGWRAAPFKSQNMALNSAVTADGLEIGRAQAMQAEAAGIEADVRMNPVLLKPSSDTGSQVVVLGKVRGQMEAAAYFSYKRTLFPEIRAAYKSLAAEYDVIVIEGAGSPVELNLRAGDIVNMGLAEAVDAPVLLAGDIDRGGVFAQLYGTAALLSPQERRRLQGLILNKFRGDVSLLRPGLGQLESLCAAPVLGVVPWLDARLDDEDSLSPALSVRAHGKPLDIAVIRLPRLSNFTDFAPLDRHPLLGVRYAGSRKELGDPDLIILPGTKSSMADLRWLRNTGLAAAVQDHAARGTPVLGICGGFQMLGVSIADPEGVETGQSAAMERRQDFGTDRAAVPDGNAFPGLGLLPCRTVFSAEKKRARVRGTVTAGPLSGARVEGYEIHMGVTEAADPAGTAASCKASGRSAGPGDCTLGGGAPFERRGAAFSGQGAAFREKAPAEPPRARGQGGPFCVKEDGTPDGWIQGNVWGTYLHGLFDTGEAADRLAAYLCARKGIPYTGSTAVYQSPAAWNPVHGPDAVPPDVVPPDVVPPDAVSSGDASGYNSAPAVQWMESQAAYRERQYNLLADGVRRALDMDRIRKIIEEWGR